MKMFTRIAVLMVFVASLLLPAAAFAQEDGCYGLSVGDCALFTTHDQDFTSFAMSYEFSMDVTGEEPVSVTSTGSGSMTVNPDAEDPLASFSMAMTIEGAATTDGETESSDQPMEFRIIDGFFYINIPEEGGWYKMSLEDAMASSGVPADMLDMGGMGEMAEMEGMETPSFLSDYYTVTRAADTDLNGTNVAVFDANFDLVGLLNDPDLGTQLSDFLMQQPDLMGSLGGGAEMTEEELQQSAQMMGMMLPMFGMMFSDSSIAYSTWVSPDTTRFHGFDLNLAMTIDPSMLMGMMGGEADADEEMPEPINFNMNLAVTITDYNAEFQYEVPADAEEMDMSGMGMGF